MQKGITYINKFSLGILFLLTLATVYLFFGPVFSNPNNYLMAAGGDGLKTYYSSQWYITHNPSGATHTGLAYPTGNHIVYADLNPLLSGVLRFVNNNIIDISRHVVGITNLTLILSFFPCVWFVFLILRKNLIPPIFSIFFALTITWLCPQIGRFTGHYALSYLFFVPMLWYFLIRICEGKRFWLWVGLYAVSILLFEFAHPYHFLIGMGFFFVYMLVHSLQQWQVFKENWKKYLAGLALVMLPVLVLKGWEIATTETPVDFVKYPYGFMYYLAGFTTIFAPTPESPFYGVWNYFGFLRHFLVESQYRSPFEGAAYVGIVGFLIGLTMVFRMGRYLWKKQWIRILIPVFPDALRPAIWASALLLIAASALPFQYFPSLTEAFGFVRQFRSLGRLAWPFYFVFMTLSCYYLYVFYRNLRIRTQGSKLWIAGLAMIGACILLWGMEARIQTKKKRDYFLQNTINPAYVDWREDYKKKLAEKGFRPSDFQAILAFPFYHIGSEKLSHEGWHSSFYSKAVSLSTGLPIVNNYVARAPLSTSLETIQLVSHPYIPKTLPGKFPNKKPLLLLYTYSESDPPFREKYLIDQSRLLFRHNKIHFALLDISAFKDQRRVAHQEFYSLRDSLSSHGNEYYSSTPTTAVVMDGFGDRFFDGDSLGGKAKRFSTKERMLIYEGEIPANEWDLPMEASVWVQLDQESNYLPSLICQQFEDGKSVDWAYAEMKKITDIYKGWGRASVDFTLKKPGNTLKIFVDGDRLSFDNLLIKPKGVNIYFQERADSSFVKNNYWINAY